MDERDEWWEKEELIGREKIGEKEVFFEEKEGFFRAEKKN